MNPGSQSAWNPTDAPTNYFEEFLHPVRCPLSSEPEINSRPHHTVRCCLALVGTTTRTGTGVQYRGWYVQYRRSSGICLSSQLQKRFSLRVKLFSTSTVHLQSRLNHQEWEPIRSADGDVYWNHNFKAGLVYTYADADITVLRTAARSASPSPAAPSKASGSSTNVGVGSSE